MEHGQAVTKANGDVTPDLAVGQLEDAVGRSGRVVFGQTVHDLLQALEALAGEQAVDGAQATLMDGAQFAVRTLEADHIVDEGHQQVQLGLAPEVLPLLAVGGVVDDNLRDGLHQVGVLCGVSQAVPGVGVLHIQKIEQAHLVALIPEKAGHGLVKLALGIHQDQTLPALGALEDEGLDKPAALTGACGAVDHGVLGQAAALLQRHILGILIVIVRIVLVFPENGAGELFHRSGLQDFGPLPPVHKAAGAVGAVRQDVKATFILDELVAGEPGVALLGDEADE